MDTLKSAPKPTTKIIPMVKKLLPINRLRSNSEVLFKKFARPIHFNF